MLGSDAAELRVSVERAHKPRERLELKIQEVVMRDAALREAIVGKWRQQLEQGQKQWVGNRGFRRYLRKARAEADEEGDPETEPDTQEEPPETGAVWQVEEAKIADEAQFDGVWALRTNTSLAASEVALKYKQLWQVEQSFRTAKSLLRTRPVYHRRDETIRGHVFCSFLALVLKKELERRLREAGIEAEWAEVMRDLGRLRETEVELQGKRFVVRSKAYGAVGQIVRSVGARLPATVRRVGEAGAEPAQKPTKQAA